MTSREAMIYQLKNLKGKPLKQKLEHIYTYFRIPILVVLMILVFAVSYIVHLATLKDTVLSVTCINAYTDYEKADAYALEYADHAGIDTEEAQVVISSDIIISDQDALTSYESSQKLVAHIAAQGIDVIAGDLETVEQYFYQDFFADLRDILTLEQQSAYEEYFLYMDLAVMKALEESMDAVPQYPDPTKPEDMAQPVPVALMLPAEGSFTGTFFPHSKDRAVVSVVVNSPNIPNAVAFLDYIME